MYTGSSFLGLLHYFSKNFRALGGLHFSGLIVILLFMTGCHRGPKFFTPPSGADISRGILHEVDKRDSLKSLAKYYQRDRSLLIYLNDMQPPYKVRSGQVLYIPPDNTDSVVRNGILTLDDIRAGRQGGPEGSAQMARVTSPQTQSSRSYVAANRGKQPTPVAGLARPSSFPDSTDDASGPEPDPRFALVWPISGSYARGFSKTGWQKFHMGVDLVAPEGAPIRAAQGGKVLFSGKTSDVPAFGNIVVIDHGNGFSTLYAHCSEIVARAGEEASQGQVIAKVGSTGNATGSHLHLELRYRGSAVNPERYFPQLQKSARVADRVK